MPTKVEFRQPIEGKPVFAHAAFLERSNTNQPTNQPTNPPLLCCSKMLNISHLTRRASSSRLSHVNVKWHFSRGKKRELPAKPGQASTNSRTSPRRSGSNMLKFYKRRSSSARKFSLAKKVASVSSRPPGVVRRRNLQIVRKLIAPQGTCWRPDPADR